MNSETIHPKATVAAIISRNQSEVLLALRNTEPYKGFWCLPGGHIDQYEDAHDAVIREVKEETGLIYAPNFSFYSDEIIPDRKIHNVVLIFHGKAAGDISFDPEEISDVKWFTFNEARDKKLAFLHNKIFDKYINSSPNEVKE